LKFNLKESKIRWIYFLGADVCYVFFFQIKYFLFCSNLHLFFGRWIGRQPKWVFWGLEFFSEIQES
jgi:hypothetical protein